MLTAAVAVNAYGSEYEQTYICVEMKSVAHHVPPREIGSHINPRQLDLRFLSLTGGNSRRNPTANIYGCT